MRKILDNKVILFTIAILLLINIAILVFFVWLKDPQAETARDKSPVTMFLQKEIGFNERQMQEFKALRQQHRTKMKPLFENMRLTKIRFFRLLKDPVSADSVVSRAATEIGNTQRDIDQQAFKNFKEIRTLGTADQQLKYDSLISGVINKMWFAPKKNKK